MLDNVNEILVTLTVALAIAAVALRVLLRINKVEWVGRFVNWVLEYVDVGLSAIVIALVIRSFVVEPFRIPSSSMEDTLLIGDQLFVNRFIYGMRLPFTKARPLSVRAPRRGDIIVFVPPQDRTKDFIKRCIGTPGDVLEIKEDQLWVNGKKLDEPYVIHKRMGMVPDFMRNMKKFTVPPGKYFMMGDNRDLSDDSRRWGFANFEDMKGNALFTFFSWNSDPAIPAWNIFRKIRWGRMFRAIH